MKSNFLLKRKKLNSSEIKKELIKNKKIKFNSEKLEDIIFIYREKKAKNMFENQFKKEENLEKKLEIIKKIIELDDVEEEYIYNYIKIEKELNKNFNDSIQTQKLIMKLNEDNYKELKLSLEYINNKKKYFEEIDLISSFNKNDNIENLMKNLEYKNNENKKFFSSINQELEVNMPISFKKNENLMYLLIRDFILNDFIINNNDKEYLMNRIFYIKKEKEILKNIAKKNKREQNLIFFSLFSLKKSDNINNCMNKFNNISFDELCKKYNNILIIDNTLTGKIKIKNSEFKIKIFNIEYFHLYSIFNFIDSNEFNYNSIKEIYDDINILKCVKIEYMNEINYYTPDLKELKTIIFEILSSKAMDEYLMNILII